MHNLSLTNTHISVPRCKSEKAFYHYYLIKILQIHSLQICIDYLKDE